VTIDRYTPQRKVLYALTRPNKRVQATPYSLRFASASGRA